MSLTAVSDLYARARGVMSASQSSIDALATFMNNRASLEESYAKSLSKLSKTGLLIDGEADSLGIQTRSFSSLV